MDKHRRWMWALGFGVLLLVAGGLVVGYAAVEHDTASRRFGVLCEVVAFAHIALGILLRRYYALGRHLMLAAIYALIGAFFLIFPDALPVAFVLLIGYAFVFVGLLRIGSAAVRRGLPGRFWLLPAGLVSAGVGVMILLAWPVPALWMVRMLIGVELLVGGAATLVLAQVLRREARAGAARREVRQPRAWVRAAGLLTVTALFLAGLWLSVLPLTKLYVDKVFAAMPGLSGSIGAIEFDAGKRVVTIRDLRVRMLGPKGQVNTFVAPRFIMRPDLKSILRGEFIGSVAFIHPKINFTRPPPERRLKPAEMAEIRRQVRRLAPFRIDRIDVRGATLALKNVLAELDVNVSHFNLVGRDLANAGRMRKNPYSTYTFAGRAMGAKMEGELRANLMAKVPTMRIKAKIRDLPVVRVNDYLKSEYKMAAQGGTLTAFTEITVTGRKLDGYARTFFTDLDVSPWPPAKKAKGFFGKLGRALKEAIQDLGVKALSYKEGTLATETPIGGEVGSPELDLISSAGGALRHAFGKSLDAGFKRVQAGS